MAPTSAMTAPLLFIDKLDVSFGHSQVVRNVSFSINAGEKFALVGESGSGKSVTALSILRLVEDASYGGSINFEGINLLKQSERVMRGVRGRDIAMIFQEPMTALDPLFTVGNQIEEVLSLHEGLSGSAARRRSIELLAKTGVPNAERRVDSYPHQLSGGQRQRAMIAMALACRPKLLIADEPTTALDVTIQAQILDLLDQLQAEFGMAILFITHDLNLVRRFTHRVGVMEKGDLVEIGDTATVFGDPQHAYTKRLIASRPERRVQPLGEGAPLVLQGENLRVSFTSSLGFFRKSVFHAVDGVTLNVRRGETLGVVGESGSGKSTLAMALLGLQGLSGGTVLLDGTGTDPGNRRALLAMRKRIQVVFQDPFGSLNPRMTVGQIVLEGLNLHYPGLSSNDQGVRLGRALDEVGLGSSSGLLDVAGRYPHEFSGGQRQRIAIARVLILEPELVVLDEPTSALDVSVQQQILRLLADLQVSHSMSYVFISHDLAVVRAMSHRVAVMKDGKIVEEGEAEELFANPRQEYTRALLAAAHL